MVVVSPLKMYLNKKKVYQQWQHLLNIPPFQKKIPISNFHIISANDLHFQWCCLFCSLHWKILLSFFRMNHHFSIFAIHQDLPLKNIQVKILRNLCQITRGLYWMENEHHLKGVRHYQINIIKYSQSILCQFPTTQLVYQ